MRDRAEQAMQQCVTCMCHQAPSRQQKGRSSPLVITNAMPRQNRVGAWSRSQTNELPRCQIVPWRTAERCSSACAVAPGRRSAKKREAHLDARLDIGDRVAGRGAPGVGQVSPVVWPLRVLLDAGVALVVWLGVVVPLVVCLSYVYDFVLKMLF